MDNKITDEILYESLKNLNKHLIKDLPNEEDLDYEFSNGFKEKIDNLFLNRGKYKSVYKSSQKAAAVFVIVSISILTLSMSVEGLRTRILSITRQIYENFTTYMFSIDSTEGDSEQISWESLVPTYIPNTFEETDKVESENNMLVTYSNDNGGLIFYDVSKLIDMNINIDTEGATINEITINGFKADYIVKGSNHSLIWNDKEYLYNISVDFPSEFNEQQSKEQLIKIAKSVK
ncbi:DUF4367 domain-containing protein [Romboutsia weinsteinii]|uniref:DUF4367 domain-containing protein n=1 Tax=Romboutsia weinsteinii TaxID=2020949 RepID=A0A371J940_9FIRM|nr:DUF4367 domain-containing protein [Romboutsia weinsteinii]RDY29233.1 DUF4367 domain-containing protein [Romboutsia weinsteinii]